MSSLDISNCIYLLSGKVITPDYYNNKCRWMTTPEFNEQYNLLNQSIAEFISDMHTVFPEYEGTWEYARTNMPKICEFFITNGLTINASENVVVSEIWHIGSNTNILLPGLSYNLISECPGISDATLVAFQHHLLGIQQLCRPFSRNLARCINDTLVAFKQKPCNLLDTNQYSTEFDMIREALEVFSTDESAQNPTVQWLLNTVCKAMYTTHTDIVVELLNILTTIGISIPDLKDIKQNESKIIRAIRRFAVSPTKRQKIIDKFQHWSRYMSEDYMPWFSELMSQGEHYEQTDGTAPSITSVFEDIREALSSSSVTQMLDDAKIPKHEIVTLLANLETELSKPNGNPNDASAKIIDYAKIVGQRMFNAFMSKFGGNNDEDPTGTDNQPSAKYKDAKSNDIRERLRAKLNQKQVVCNNNAIDTPEPFIDKTIDEWLSEFNTMEPVAIRTNKNGKKKGKN